MDLDVAQLGKNEFFSHFTEPELKKLLEHGNINRFQDNTAIFLQGDPGEAMYILLTGEVQILLDTKDGMEEIVATLKPGELFGEGSFAANIPRSAKALSTRDSYVYVLTADHLNDLIDREGTVAARLLNAVLNVVIDRLVITNKRLASS